MASYRLLTHPGANRVYAQQAAALGTAELVTVSRLALGDRLLDIHPVEHGRGLFLAFRTEQPLTADDRRLLANLAAGYVLFEVHDGLLGPVDEPPLAVFADDLVTIPKYAGKTNEQFTTLLLNLALSAARPGFDALLAGEAVRVLDPLCGRGTTLNQALRYGADAVGIDADHAALEAELTFVKRYLEHHRVKHRRERARARLDGRATARVTLTIRPDGHRPLVLDVIHDDSVFARDHLKASSANIVVADLPYGVQHRARNDDWGASRNPEALLRDALTGWRSVLRGDGAIALAYNTKVITRDCVDHLLVDHGYRLVDAVTDGRFSHRVDQSIQRDLSLATKPA